MMWRSSNTIRTGHDASHVSLLPGGQYAEGWILFLPRIERIYVVGAIEEIKKFVAFPGLTPLQPDVDAQPNKRASLSDHPHPSGLPTGRQETNKTK